MVPTTCSCAARVCSSAVILAFFSLILVMNSSRISSFSASSFFSKAIWSNSLFERSSFALDSSWRRRSISPSLPELKIVRFISRTPLILSDSASCFCNSSTCADSVVALNDVSSASSAWILYSSSSFVVLLTSLPSSPTSSNMSSVSIFSFKSRSSFSSAKIWSSLSFSFTSNSSTAWLRSLRIESICLLSFVSTKFFSVSAFFNSSCSFSNSKESILAVSASTSFSFDSVSSNWNSTSSMRSKLRFFSDSSCFIVI
mmetsp:Transcript_20134/g.31442  ORF Transcript_20134/g.31442 Transcript_20134/m.31442 type:complete len:257 (+) Transcript_20134:918-1688(+)